ncbi:MAG: hypothetical protein IPH07_20690 [Deltaproteobacteria bacterium]|nr:hypothetical protein [Deltaproteobacteria bacterium]MBP7286798.1 hypothetical protein [Nannocystaceae bacterium]
MTACSGSVSSSKLGELGNGTFEYRCVGLNDPACGLDELTPTFPDCMLVGGRFDLGFTLRDFDEVSDLGSDFVFVRAASESFFGSGAAFTTLRTGNAAFAAFADDHVVDVLHLDLVAPSGTEILQVGGGVVGDTLSLARGETLELLPRGTALASGCVAAGGAVPFTATAEDPAIVQPSVAQTLSVTGVALGTTTLTVELGDTTRSITVTVEGEQTTGETATDSGSSGSDGSSDSSGSGSDSGGSDSGSGGSSGGSTGGSSGSTGGI